MQADIINQIKKLNNITDVVILTHNIDFVFLQTVFLSALKKCGHPNLTILADAHCAIDSYKHQSSVITGLGKRYRVIPVLMSPGFRFHPKAILLSGNESATLFIGSGNMTFGGVRENAEVWSRFDISENESGKFTAFREYFKSIMPFVGFSNEVEKDIAEAFELSNHAWVSLLTKPDGLWHSPGSKQSLAETIIKTIGKEEVKKLTVCTPYFDKHANALTTLYRGLGSPNTDVYIQSNKSTLLNSAAKCLPDNIVVKSVQAKKGTESSNRFVHAKWYGVETDNNLFFFHGSANCSNAALTGIEPRCNAELMIINKMTKSDFETTVLSDLIFKNEPPVLIEEHDETEETSTCHINIMSARYEFGVLKVYYHCSINTKITSLMVNSESHFFEKLGDNEILARVTNHPSSIFITGVFEDTEIVSNHIWVDDESLLRSNATSRSIIETIRSAQNDKGHNPSKWVLIFDLLNKNLEQMSSRELLHQPKLQEAISEHSIKINKGLLTSESYTGLHALPILQSSRVMSSVSIYSLLLQSFGISGLAQLDEKLEAYSQIPESGDGGDIPEEVPIKTKTSNSVTSASAGDIEKLTNRATQIINRFCSSEFLSLRHPQRLSLDIQVIGLLLRKAFSMGWIDKKIYFDLSHKVWSALFFHSDKNSGKGWLETRFEAESDKQLFLSLFASPMLTASLYSWFSAIQIEPGNIYSHRFLLSQIMAMGRCPWLWISNKENNIKVTENLLKIWSDSPCGSGNTSAEDLFSAFSLEISKYGEIGVGFYNMENELNKIDIKEIRSKVPSGKIKTGDVLWQGEKGICLAMEAVDEDKKEINILCLQEPERISRFKSNYLIPMKGLLDSTELFSNSFIEHDKPTLISFINEFQTFSLRF